MTDPRNRSRSGQSIIEFQLVIVLFLLTIFGTFEICRLLLSYTTLANASRVAMRYASVHGSSNDSGYIATTTEVETIVREFTKGSWIDPAQVTVTTTWPGSNDPGGPVSVRVSYPYQPFILLPMQTNLAASVEGIVTY